MTSNDSGSRRGVLSRSFAPTPRAWPPVPLPSSQRSRVRAEYPPRHSTHRSTPPLHTSTHRPSEQCDVSIRRARHAHPPQPVRVPVRVRVPLPLPLPLKPAPAPADRGAQVSPQDLDVVQLEPLLCVVTDPMKSVTKLGRLACLQRVATASVSAERGGLLLAQEAWLDGAAWLAH